MPFTLAVPSDASPGDHAGGIVALAVSPAKRSKSRVRFTVRQGVGVRVYLMCWARSTPAWRWRT